MMSVREAARAMGISPTSVRLLMRRGELPYHRPTRGRVVLSEADVAAHLERTRHQGISPAVPLRRVSLDPGTKAFGRRM
jgi:excisionase family DNA binding protein